MTLLGRAHEELFWHPADGSLGSVSLGAIARPSEVLACAPSPDRASAHFEGNRSVIVADAATEIAGRTMHLSVKGVGAAAPMYGAHPFRQGVGGQGTRRITRESWMGEAPFGGQGEAGALAALALSQRTDGLVLSGLHLCPTIAVTVVPESLVDPALHYRRYEGRVVQEQRLVPSDVRLFAGSERTLGLHADEVLRGFGVATVDALESFLERLLRTATALLTMFARTLRPSEHGPVGLDLDDVWLDKDAVIAPDGALFFVDLEALEWAPAWPSVEARVRRQIGRNAYELFYALDVLLDVRERWRERRPSAAERRAVLGALLPMALEGDPFVRAEPAHGLREGGWDLVVVADGREVAVPFFEHA